MIDNYSLRARYYPVIILFFPIVILGFFYSVQFQSLVHAFTSIGVVSALTYLFSQLGRDQGKLKEPELWNGWGGTPSLQLLRLRDKHLDRHTKERYHNKLKQLCPVSIQPNDLLESTDPTVADEVYKSWTKYLITQTRDSKKFSLLLKENTSYGFRRNLWGVKPFAIMLLALLLLANYLYWIIKLKTINPALYPNSFIFSAVALLLIFLFWLIVVSRSWVKIAAFAYAERLLESLDVL
jgi:hypothetical protein